MQEYKQKGITEVRVVKIKAVGAVCLPSTALSTRQTGYLRWPESRGTGFGTSIFRRLT